MPERTSEETWVLNKERLEDLTADDPAACLVAEHFKLLADALDGVVLDDQNRCSEDVALLLSTCRNGLLTVNALFEDLSRVLGHGRKPSPIARAIESTRRGELNVAERELNEAGALLEEVSSKFNVWGRRNELWDAFERHLDSHFDRLQRGKVRGLLNDVRIPDRLAESAWMREYFQLDFSEKPWLAEYFREISKAQKTASWVAGSLRALLGWLYAKAAEGIPPPPRQAYLPLGGDKQEKEPLPPPSQGQAWNQLRDILKTGCDSPHLQVHDNANDVFEIEQARTNGASITSIINEGANIDLAAAILDILEYETRRLYDRLLDGPFKPNVARTPLPRPFRLDLRPPESTPSLLLGRVTVQTVSCGLAVNEPARVRVAFFDGGIAKEFYTDSTYKDEPTRKRVTSFLMSSVDIAAQEGAQAIVFPECSIPDSACQDLQRASCSKGIVIIGGVESQWTRHGKKRNRAVICIPSETQPSYQGKQRPSGYETRIEDFESDGIINVYYNTPLGCFAVLVCSDILEADVIAALANSRRMPEIVFVCTMNQYPSLFEKLVIADTYRLYSYAAAVNNRDFVADAEKDLSGVIVAGPFNPKRPSVLEKSTETLLNCNGLSGLRVSLNMFDLDLINIRARSHGKPADGFCHVPHHRNRTG